MPGREARLAEQRRLLVAGDARHRHREPGGTRRVGDPEAATARANLGQARARDAEQVEQLVGPVAGVDVEEHGAAGVRRLGGVHAGEVPQDPRVDGAEREVGRRRRRRPRRAATRAWWPRSRGRARARCAPAPAARRRRRAARRSGPRCGGPATRWRGGGADRCARSHTTTVSRWLVMPMPTTVSPSSAGDHLAEGVLHRRARCRRGRARPNRAAGSAGGTRGRRRRGSRRRRRPRPCARRSCPASMARTTSATFRVLSAGRRRARGRRRGAGAGTRTRACVRRRVASPAPAAAGRCGHGAELERRSMGTSSSTSPRSGGHDDASVVERDLPVVTATEQPTTRPATTLVYHAPPCRMP